MLRGGSCRQKWRSRVSIAEEGGFLLNRDEVRQLYDQHSRGLLAYACSLLPSFAAAEDVLHQVFERLLRGDLEITVSPVPYLYRAIRNAALNAIRAGSRNEDFDEGWLKSLPGMEEAAIDLQAALRELPEEQREIIMLHVWGGMTFDEVGVALGISRHTAASRYRYGLSKLREQFHATKTVKRG
jgi:RNA polymerase sigma-70 factor (ECF subfamily)